MRNRISKQYLEEQKKLHQSNKNYGTASLSHVQTIKNLMQEAKFTSISDYGAGKKIFKRSYKSWL